MKVRFYSIVFACLCLLAIAAWVLYWVQTVRVVESIANFDIPFGTDVIDGDYRSSRMGADGFRVTVYELDHSYAKDLQQGCEAIGYVRMTHSEAGLRFPVLAKYLVGDQAVCARTSQRDTLSVSLLQGANLIVLVAF